MIKEKYKAGIIGLGFIGGGDQVSGDAVGQKVVDLDGTHFSAYANHPRIDLVAGSSRDPGRRERFVARSGARTYADWRTLLDKEDLDIVSVATYAPQHVQITIACAEKGVRVVYCEKPIATTIADAKAMVTACAKAGSLLVINHQRRFNASHRRLRQLIFDGGLGELTSVSTQWPAGRLGNVGSHMLDALQMLTCRKVEAVTARLDLAGKPDCRGPDFSDPGGWGMIRFKGGLVGLVDAPDYGFVEAGISVVGTEANARITGDGVTVRYRNGDEDHWPYDESGRSSMDRAADEIVTWLDGETPFPYDATDTVLTLEVIIAFHASHYHNSEWIEIPLSGADRELVVNSG